MSAKKKNKFYVVWLGLNPGIYSSWDDCRMQVNGYQGAKYKGYETEKEAAKAWEAGAETSLMLAPKNRKKALLNKIGIQIPSISVDAACSGNPGKLEYQGVWTDNGDPLFHWGPVDLGTVNVGEFLAIVHGLAWLDQNKLPFPLYSDSKIAIAWVRQKKINSKLPRDSRTEKLFVLVDRALVWLKKHPNHNVVLKWETASWGEIPADFNRK